MIRGTYHIGIKSRHVKARFAWQEVAVLQTIVQVASLEVMGNARGLGSSHVVQVGLMLSHLRNGRLERLRLAIVENNDLEPVQWVVLMTSRSNSVQNKFVVFTAASDENVNGRNIISSKSQLRPSTALGSPHCPDVVQHWRDGNGNFDGQEYPCLDVGLIG